VSGPRPRRRGPRLLWLIVLALLVPLPAAADDDRVAVTLFWGDGCPHCAVEKDFLDELTARHPQVRVEDYEVWNDAANRERLAAVATDLGFEPAGVPVTVVGDRYWIGFDEQTGREIEAAVAVLVGGPAPANAPAPAAGTAGDTIRVPLLGTFDTSTHSLLVTTALIGFVDGFNPCSLWVLTVLLAVVLHSRSRRKVALVGLTFLATTAAVYALFIAGVFGVLSYVGYLPWIQGLVAVMALTFAAINIKDYFAFRQGVSLTIPEQHKPGIYRRARRLRAMMSAEASTPALVGGAAVMGVGVSLVEFACTAGFPVIWSSAMAANGASGAVFAALLGLYLLIYLADELIVFSAAVVTLRATKLQERHGRVLKLVGGMVMLALAVVMVVAPAVMSTVTGSLWVFTAALVASAAVVVVHRRLWPRLPHPRRRHA
jgi:cytochrome c biogenesis protein CcdA/glutaredoxin